MKFARTSTLTLYKNNNGESWEIIKDWTSVNTY